MTSSGSEAQHMQTGPENPAQDTANEEPLAKHDPPLPEVSLDCPMEPADGTEQATAGKKRAGAQQEERSPLTSPIPQPDSPMEPTDGGNKGDESAIKRLSLLPQDSWRLRDGFRGFPPPTNSQSSARDSDMEGGDNDLAKYARAYYEIAMQRNIQDAPADFHNMPEIWPSSVIQPLNLGAHGPQEIYTNKDLLPTSEQMDKYLEDHPELATTFKAYVQYVEHGKRHVRDRHALGIPYGQELVYGIWEPRVAMGLIRQLRRFEFEVNYMPKTLGHKQTDFQTIPITKGKLGTFSWFLQWRGFKPGHGRLTKSQVNLFHQIMSNVQITYEEKGEEDGDISIFEAGRLAKIFLPAGWTHNLRPANHADIMITITDDKGDQIRAPLSPFMVTKASPNFVRKPGESDWFAITRGVLFPNSARTQEPHVMKIFNPIEAPLRANTGLHFPAATTFNFEHPDSSDILTKGDIISLFLQDDEPEPVVVRISVMHPETSDRTYISAYKPASMTNGQFVTHWAHCGALMGEGSVLVNTHAVSNADSLWAITPLLTPKQRHLFLHGPKPIEDPYGLEMVISKCDRLGFSGGTSNEYGGLGRDLFLTVMEPHNDFAKEATDMMSCALALSTSALVKSVADFLKDGATNIETSFRFKALAVTPEYVKLVDDNMVLPKQQTALRVDML